jgi:hypothetical protein
LNGQWVDTQRNTEFVPAWWSKSGYGSTYTQRTDLRRSVLAARVDLLCPEAGKMSDTISARTTRALLEKADRCIFIGEHVQAHEFITRSGKMSKPSSDGGAGRMNKGKPVLPCQRPRDCRGTDAIKVFQRRWHWLVP